MTVAAVQDVITTDCGSTELDNEPSLTPDSSEDFINIESAAGTEEIVVIEKSALPAPESATDDKAGLDTIEIKTSETKNIEVTIEHGKTATSSSSSDESSEIVHIDHQETSIPDSELKYHRNDTTEADDVPEKSSITVTTEKTVISTKSSVETAVVTPETNMPKNIVENNVSRIVTDPSNTGSCEIKRTTKAIVAEIVTTAPAEETKKSEKESVRVISAPGRMKDIKVAHTADTVDQTKVSDKKDQSKEEIKVISAPGRMRTEHTGTRVVQNHANFRIPNSLAPGSADPIKNRRPWTTLIGTTTDKVLQEIAIEDSPVEPEIIEKPVIETPIFDIGVNTALNIEPVSENSEKDVETKTEISVQKSLDCATETLTTEASAANVADQAEDLSTTKVITKITVEHGKTDTPQVHDGVDPDQADVTLSKEVEILDAIDQTENVNHAGATVTVAEKSSITVTTEKIELSETTEEVPAVEELLPSEEAPVAEKTSKIEDISDHGEEQDVTVVIEKTTITVTKESVESSAVVDAPAIAESHASEEPSKVEGIAIEKNTVTEKTVESPPAEKAPAIEEPAAPDEAFAGGKLPKVEDIVLEKNTDANSTVAEEESTAEKRSKVEEILIEKNTITVTKETLESTPAADVAAAEKPTVVAKASVVEKSSKIEDIVLEKTAITVTKKSVESVAVEEAGEKTPVVEEPSAGEAGLVGKISNVEGIEEKTTVTVTKESGELPDTTKSPAEKAPVVEEAPAVAEVALVEKTSTVEDIVIQKTKETPAEKAPVADKTPEASAKTLVEDILLEKITICLTKLTEATATEEALMVEKSPAIEETTVVDEVPTAEGVPVPEKTSKVDHIIIEKSTISITKETVESPVTEEVPVVDEVAAVEKAPVVSAAPAAEKTSKVEDIVIEKTTVTVTKETTESADKIQTAEKPAAEEPPVTETEIMQHTPVPDATVKTTVEVESDKTVEIHVTSNAKIEGDVDIHPTPSDPSNEIEHEITSTTTVIKREEHVTITQERTVNIDDDIELNKQPSAEAIITQIPSQNETVADAKKDFEKSHATATLTVIEVIKTKSDGVPVAKETPSVESPEEVPVPEKTIKIKTTETKNIEVTVEHGKADTSSSSSSSSSDDEINIAEETPSVECPAADEVPVPEKTVEVENSAEKEGQATETITVTKISVAKTEITPTDAADKNNDNEHPTLEAIETTETKQKADSDRISTPEPKKVEIEIKDTKTTIVTTETTEYVEHTRTVKPEPAEADKASDISTSSDSSSRKSSDKQKIRKFATETAQPAQKKEGWQFCLKLATFGLLCAFVWYKTTTPNVGAL